MQGLQLCMRQQGEHLGWRETIRACALPAAKGITLKNTQLGKMDNTREPQQFQQLVPQRPQTKHEVVAKQERIEI